ncbi:OmpH family outer membrane protein [Roseovarius aestuarii]|uniref:Outer membrane protein (OmpH-like) n=1 Tax=Roseovarius aestuarii TaxID=475083 RepID=A0A1X7BPQ0_9RHOB|nr:OmpH family outer membrane protein [Roseovarius aestuarii]SMC11595.1 Outer membrane protein (OmpH-like) [Roseovarius aestuarii]
MHGFRGVIQLVIALTMMACLPALSQNTGVVQSDILLLDPDRLFTETQLGQRINRDYLAKREKLIAQNDKIAAELEAEELSLTEKRAGLSPEEFRELADAFDVKVQEIRRDSERAVRELERSRDRAPVTFMRIVEPVLVQLMRESGGAVILDVRSVLLRADVVDITSVAIRRVDAEIGNGLPVQQDDAPQEIEPEN